MKSTRRYNKKEESLAQKVSKWLAIQHKNIIYRFDVGADVKLSIPQATKLARLQGRWSKGYPDLLILKPNKRHAGLFIELKMTSPYKKDGQLKKDKHLETQANMHTKLREAGYYATFATGFDEVKDIISEYLEE